MTNRVKAINRKNKSKSIIEAKPYQDNFSNQKYYEGGPKKVKETDHIFAPLTQAEIIKINSENSKNNKYHKINNSKIM